jgi:hypothetical protein
VPVMGGGFIAQENSTVKIHFDLHTQRVSPYMYMHAEINSRKNPKIYRNSRLEIIIIIIFFFFDFPAISMQAQILESSSD